PACTVRLAQAAPRTVALDGVLDLAAHGESNARRLWRFPPQHHARPARRARRGVARDGVLARAAHGEPNARRLGRSPPQHDERRAIDPAASLEERREFRAGVHPLASRKAPRYTVSRLRPLARRRLSTLRPPFVLMRSRNPWVFARRRRFG